MILSPFSNCKLLQVLVFCLFIFCESLHTQAQTDPNHPNILLVIADDLGVDASHGYTQSQNNLLPTTPTLDSLRNAGLTFKNAWAAPKCTPTRATIMSGKYGVHTGVNATPGNLDASLHTSIFKALGTLTSDVYADALIGKWHISAPTDYTHPTQHGVDHYEGAFISSVADYYNWDKVTNGVESTETTYATVDFTNASIDWVNAQTQPWFLWLAHVAPHSPYHLPPDSLYTMSPTGTNRRKYLAAIEAMDSEIGRLLDSIPDAVRNNTVVIYIGDNGTPPNVIQNYASNQGKGSLYQGGVHVPMIVSGVGVSRQNEEEQALVHATDIYATILDITGANLPGGIYNSMSFNHLLSSTGGNTRPYNFTEIENNGVFGYTIRDAQYKLIEYADGTQEFYDLIADTLETNNLVNSLTTLQEATKTALEAEAEDIQNGWSCQDLIQNGTETDIDVCATVACTNDNSLSFNLTNCCVSPAGASMYVETVTNDVRYIQTNNFPDHDYCHTNANVPAPKNYNFEIDVTPTVAASTTSVLTATNSPDRYFGVALNGVMLAPAPAAPFIFENPNTGEYNWDWVFEPTNNIGPGGDAVSLDCASAHTGPQGYHYHGNMFEYVEGLQTGISTATTSPSEPLQVGWASDGFPILYRFGPDANGSLTLLQPSYQVKSGDRPGDGTIAPCGPYNGKYTNDYEYVSGLGDLDECNGVQRTITLNTTNGVETFDYFYMVTDTFPQISRCMAGTPDPTFDNSNSGTASVSLQLKVYLEGPYNASGGNNFMTTYLETNNLLPTQQPFNTAPWNYAGVESVPHLDDLPSNAVDWVLVEVRDATDNYIVIDQKAAVVLNDGTVTGVDSPTHSTIEFYGLLAGTDYYISVKSRNHLAILSNGVVNLPNSTPFDLTNIANIMGGTTVVADLGGNLYGCFAGDFNANGTITVADFNIYQTQASLITTYVAGDANMDGSVTVSDYNLYLPNSSKIAPLQVRY